MSLLLEDLGRIAFIGILATAAMDLWQLLLRRLRIPTMDFALLGRWLGHALKGRWMHAAIAKSPPVRGEAALGWSAHYAIGIGFAALLAGLAGMDWLRNPTPAPAFAFGLASVAAPWLLMQPAMGAGIASSRTATPGKNRLRSLATHLVFGAGLYLAALLIG